MYYSGYFRNTDTTIDEAGQLFKVVIITNFKKQEYNYGGELMLSDSPFIVNYESEDGNIYKPYKCSTATVGILQTKYNFEFSNTSGNNVLVTLLRFKNSRKEEDIKDSELDPNYPKEVQIDNICYSVEWVGYATPNTYSQSFEDYFAEFELECQDALSTLQYFRYKIKDLQRNFISFIDIINSCCTSIKTYKHIYIADTLRLPTSEEGDIFNFCYIDQRNFFDEDEVAKTSLEVIEQLCLYFNLSIIPYGDSLYIVDYNGIKNGYNSYYHYKYTLENKFTFCNYNEDNLNAFSLQKYKVKFEDLHDIKEDDFSSTGTKLSLLSTFNKLSVKSSLYSFDSISPDFEDLERWENSSISDEVGRYDDYNIIIESGGEYAAEHTTDNEIAKWCDGSFTDGVFKPNRRKDEDKYLTVIGNTRKNNNIQKVYIKYLNFKDSTSLFNNSELKTYWYENDYKDSSGVWYKGAEVTSINSNKAYSYNNMRNYTGAQFIAYAVETVKENEKARHPLTLELKPAVLISTPSELTYHEAFESTKNNPSNDIFNQPMFKIKSKSICIGSGDFIVLSFKMKCYKDTDCLPINVDATDDVDRISRQHLGISFNGYNYTVDYYYGTNEKNILIPFKFETDEKKAFGADLEFTDTKLKYNFKDKLGVDSGIILPTRFGDTENHVEFGDFEITFYRPYGAKSDIPVKCTLIEDFKIQLVTRSDINGVNAYDDNTDTEYSNVLDDEAVEEKSSIELDVTTWDNKQANYSSVIYSHIMNNMSNDLFTKELARVRHVYNKSTGEILRPEEHIINNNILQYSTPTVNLNLNLHILPLPYSTFTYHFFKDKLFIVDGSEYDYGNNSYNINLIEKK